MMGVTLTIMKLDEELKQLIDMDCYSMGLKQASVQREPGAIDGSIAQGS